MHVNVEEPAEDREQGSSHLLLVTHNDSQLCLAVSLGNSIITLGSLLNMLKS
jgi:hypothetical protein